MADIDARHRAANEHLKAGRVAEAGRLFAALAAEQPDNATFAYMEAVVARAGGDLNAAISHLERARSLAPDRGSILTLLAHCRLACGDKAAAIDLYRTAHALAPDDFAVTMGLADLLFDQNGVREAADLYGRAAARDPDNPDPLWKRGVALVRCGEGEAAIPFLERALQQIPDHHNAIMALGEAYSMRGQHDEALVQFRRAADMRPDSAAALSNLGKALRLAGRLGEAAEVVGRAVAMAPDDPGLRQRYGLILQNQGRLDEAIAQYEAGQRADPRGIAGTNSLMAMHYHPGFAPDEIADAHKEWGARFGAEIAPATPTVFAARPKDPVKRLKIGYLSPDFRRHSVSYFIRPLLERHDREKVEVHAVANLATRDAVTAEIESVVDRWHDIRGLSDDQAADLIRDAGIDILVDLAGHTGENRLGVLARRAAPVQATYLGYPNTTGLAAVDYRISDAVADPPDGGTWHSETLVRLPNGFLCYRPAGDAPPVGERATGAGRAATFGCFNNIAKISAPVIESWAGILRAVPGSLLVLKATSLSDEDTRRRTMDRLTAGGVARDRVTLRPPAKAHRDHLAAYRDIDVALDTFPYNGTTTTCEALWMGVPVVTFAGDGHVGRVGASILTAAGLSGLIADDRDGYVAAAVRLAERRERDVAGSALRARVAGSALCDEAGFARDLEAAYRDMWRRWCAEDGAG